MFSQTADYALRVVAFLASRTDRRSTFGEMSEGICVNVPYLRKVLDKLREADLVEAQRGSGGGLRLTADPEQLTLLDVVNAIDPLRHIEGCPLGISDHLELCPLHGELEEAICQMEKLLSSRTIGELISHRRMSARCSFPKEQTELYQL